MKRKLLTKLFSLKTILLLGALTVGGANLWADVWVRRTLDHINNNDVVIIVDMNSGNAIANNPAEGKVPGAVAVKFNEDQNRITSEAGDLANVQWKVTKAGGKVQFTKDPKGEGEDVLLCVDSEKSELRVATASNSNNKFDMSNGYLHISISEKNYYVGISSSFMSTSWALKENTNDIANTEIAFFVKSNKDDITLTFPYRNYEADFNNGSNSFTAPTATANPAKTVTYSSDNTAVATVDASTGVVTLVKRGTAKITASFAGDETYNEYYTSYTLRVDDSTQPGSRTAPFTVTEAMSLAQNNTVTIGGNTVTREAGCCYFIKGIVSKVSNPFSDMLGGIEIPGMEDIDLSQLNIPGMSSSGGTSYFISNDGTTDSQLKVLNGNKQTTSGNGCVEYISLTSDGIGVGDVVLVYGPLVYTEDKSMMPGGGNSGSSSSAKVNEVNYIPSNQLLRRLTEGTVKEMKDNTGKVLSEFYTLNTQTILGFTVPGTPQISMKSSDEEIAKWEKNQQGTDSTFVAKGKGTVTVTVSAKVVVTADNPNTTDVNEEKSYTMKCKYDIDVVTRDLEPLGKNNGDYELVTDPTTLKNGDVLLLVGDSSDKHYAMGNADGKMGGKEGKEVTISNNKIKSTDVPDGVLEVTLEIENNNWYFNAGKNDNNENVYLYISDPESTGGYDISSITGSGAKVKTGTKAVVGDSCKLTITAVSLDSVKIKYNIADRVKDDKTTLAKNVLKYSSSSYSSSFGGFEDSENAKGVMLHIYRFVPNPTITVAFDPVSEWRTIVCDRNVTLGTGLSAYYAESVTNGTVTMHLADTPLKAGEPYLLHGSKGWGNYELTITDAEATAPTVNLLKLSDSSTTGQTGTSTIYVLAKKKIGDNDKVGFYKWAGGLLGSGRVYLENPASAREFYPFDIDESTTDIRQLNIDSSADIYDLQGRKVVNPSKGLYIKDSKIVVVK